MNISITEQKLAFTSVFFLFVCLVLMLNVGVGVITAFKLHINILYTVVHSELFLFYLSN